MATYGEIRMRLAQLAPGVSLELLDGWIMDRHQEMLDRLSWRRIEAQRVLQTVAEYNAFTLTATNGLTAITGATTVWTAAMTGRIIRIAARGEFYQFTRTADTTGTLDRPYEGETGAGLAYRINQSVYALGTDVRIVEAARTPTAPLGKKSVAELNQISPTRVSYGEPSYWAPYPDSFTSPPVIQIELYPVPTTVVPVFLDLVLDAQGLSAGVTSSSLLPWTRPACLIAGVEADIAVHLEQFPKGEMKELRFQKLLGDMVRVEAEQVGPQRIQMHSSRTAHNVRRWTR